MGEQISTSNEQLIRENEELRARLADAETQLAEAQEVIRAIQSGDVDAVVVSGPQGEQVFTLRGAEYAYRALVEAMNEGAATLGLDGTVLYCNQRLSGLLGIPLEQMIGNPVAKLFAAEATLVFEALFSQALAGEPGTAELDFRNSRGHRIPTHVSLREMKSLDPSALCMVVTDLTERKQRDELIASGRMAASILESAAEAIAVCDHTGRIIRVNQALIDLCGSNPLFQNFDAALPLELEKGTASSRPFSILEALGGETLRAREISFVPESGCPVFLLLTAAPIKSTSGTIGCVLTMTDITERKRAEIALRESQRDFASLANLVPQFVWMCTPDGLCFYFNQRWVDYTGLSLEESYGIGWTIPFHPDDKQAAWDAWNLAFRTGGQYRIESRLRAADGSYRWFLMRGEALRNSDGEVSRWFGTCTDIEELKQAEQALLAERQLLDTVVGRMPAAVLLAEGDDLRIRLVNPAYQVFAPGKEMAGKTLEEVWPEIGPEVPRVWRHVLATGEPYSVVDQPFAIRRSPDAPLEQTYFSWSIFRVRLPGSDRWALLNTALETTERKRSQEALIRSEKLASVGRMASTIAHEINNPLETIGNVVYLAMIDPEIPPAAKSYLEIAVQELERVTHIARQTLAFHREGSTPALIDLRESIDSIVKLFTGRLESRGVAVERHYAEVGHIKAFRGDIQQVVSNLLSNSMDATSEHGSIKLRLSRTRNGSCDRVRFTIADTGCGIPSEILARVFEPFFTTKEMHGTGLGLWVTRQIVEKHGGAIRVRSKLGKGTAFSIVFPLATSARAE
jgi:PAS domain S-box-containing protein